MCLLQCVLQHVVQVAVLVHVTLVARRDVKVVNSVNLL